MTVLKFYPLILIMLTLSLLSSCQQESNYLRLNGFTMGTTYQITIRTNQEQTLKLQKLIDQKLISINQLMSTYIDDSELSLINKTDSTGCQSLSAENYYVIKNALKVSQETKGKFDITIDPLIAEWGFDKKQTNDIVPSQDVIDQLLTQVGHHKIQLTEHCLKKKISSLSINLSAIAKGYAVDEVAKLLEQVNIQHYLVEIGGETASKGLNPSLVPWRLAIEAPIEKQREIQKIFLPNGLGVATSGDYRNYFENSGVRFSHTIDPTTGKPITHNLASVTVLHNKTMLADAYATAFMVMGKEKALAFAQEHDIAIYVLVKEDNQFISTYSPAFKSHLLTH